MMSLRMFILFSWQWIRKWWTLKLMPIWNIKMRELLFEEQSEVIVMRNLHWRFFFLDVFKTLKCCFWNWCERTEVKMLLNGIKETFFPRLFRNESNTSSHSWREFPVWIESKNYRIFNNQLQIQMVVVIVIVATDAALFVVVYQS